MHGQACTWRLAELKTFQFHRCQREIDTLVTRNLPRTVGFGTPVAAPRHSCLSPSAPDCLSCSLNHWDLLSVLEIAASHFSGVPLHASQLGVARASGRRMRCRQRAQLQKAIRWPARQRALRGLISASGGFKHILVVLLFGAQLVVCLASAGDAAAARRDAQRGGRFMDSYVRARTVGTETL